jgi:hypothetical protein
MANKKAASSDYCLSIPNEPPLALKLKEERQGSDAKVK